MKEYYKIGEIAKLYNVSPDLLRYYEDIGLLRPRRDVNGYRAYSINDVRNLNVIRELRSIGFSVAEIKEHLRSFDLERTVGIFSDAIAAIDRKSAELASLRSQLAERIDEIRLHVAAGGSGPIEILTLPQRPILRLSEDVYRDDELDFVIKRLQAEYEDQLYIIGYGDVGATIPLSELTEGNYGHFDSAFYIVDPGEEFDAVLPEGRYLSQQIAGGYSQIASRWQEILAHASARGLKPCGPAIELYLIDNHDTTNEDEYVTCLQVRVE